MNIIYGHVAIKPEVIVELREVKQRLTFRGSIRYIVQKFTWLASLSGVVILSALLGLNPQISFILGFMVTIIFLG